MKLSEYQRSRSFFEGQRSLRCQSQMFDFGLYIQVSDSGPHGPLVIFLFASHLIRGQLFKKKNLAIQEQFFPLKGNPILKGLHCPGKQTGSHKSCFPLQKKKLENHGSVLIYLQWHS